MEQQGGALSPDELLLKAEAQANALDADGQTPGQLILDGCQKLNGSVDRRIQIAKLLKKYGHPRIDIAQSGTVRACSNAYVWPEICQIADAISDWESL
jgi:hypothetical protein